MSCWNKTRAAAAWTVAALLVTGGTPSCAAPRAPMPNPPRDARELFELDQPLSEDIPQFVPMLVAPQPGGGLSFDLDVTMFRPDVGRAR